ncbi:MAG: uncharacterized protein A8A55_2137 [Amphiamblys sp. WSBS2006]|nr:MAG: uncharacterized protein A8A55_2137 [Amphiamblys sp. WSBS2006]
MARLKSLKDRYENSVLLSSHTASAFEHRESLFKAHLFATVPEEVFSQLQPEKEKDMHLLDEEEAPRKLCFMYFSSATESRATSPVSLLRFFYDEQERPSAFLPITATKRPPSM